MKKRSLILLMLVLAGCQHSQTEQKSIHYNLIEDFRYARQRSAGSRTYSIFSPGLASVRNKKMPALVQHSAGQIAFFVKFAGRPALKLLPQVSGKLRDTPEAMVRVKSDFPSFLERSFPIEWNQPLEIDLQEFHGRTAAIEFSAGGHRRKKFKNAVYWVNPVTEDIVSENKEPSKEVVQNFQQRHKKENLLIVVFDAATASHFGCYGYSKPTTPFVDSFAAESVLWENAFTQAVYTIASTGTLLTGQYPNVHRVVGHSMALSEKHKTMPEALREAGFRTALFTANFNASPKAGYGQGFDHVWMPKDAFIRASDFANPVKQWLHAKSNQRFFAYIHYREPHYPFSPPVEYLTKFQTDLTFQLPIFDNKLRRDDEERRKITAAFDANLAFVDREFGKILEHLKQTGLMEKTVIALLSDHGEAFWEHRVQGHNSTLYDEVMRIPLIIRFPNETSLRGIRRTQPVGSIQIFPSIVELFQLSNKKVRWSAPSLLPIILDGDSPGEEFVISQTTNQQDYAIRSADYKYIQLPRRTSDELYLLKKDRAERENRIRDYPILAAYCRMSLEKRLKNMRISGQKLPEPETVVIDKESEEQLRALGYIQ